MSYPALIQLGHASEAPGPRPLTPPSPMLTRSVSLSSGEIPILLDPALGTPSPSIETLPASASMSSLFLPQSVSAAGSVGTFGQPVRQGARHPGDINTSFTSRTSTWRDMNSSQLSLQSFGLSRIVPDTFSSFNDTVDPGPSYSTSSTPNTASFPLVRDDDEDLSRAERDSVFTLSAYLAPASVYGDNEEKNTSVLGYDMRQAPRITRSSSLQGQGPSFSEHAFDKDEKSPTLTHIGAGKWPPFPVILAPQLQQDLSYDHDESRTPKVCPRRDPSELDVPLSPTSTFLLSPSNSTSSRFELPRGGFHLPTSEFALLPSAHQRHYRAVSAPLSSVPHPSIGLIDEALELYNASMEDRTSFPRPANRTRPRPASSSAYTPNQTLRPRSNYSLREIESVHSQFLRTSSQERPHTVSDATDIHDCSTAPPWLANTTLEMWIDQEGFRAIQPRFELVRYSNKTGSRPDGHVLDVAEFVMKKRQTWYFHHATLDSPPVLRRLAINGDTNDYISRQATLTMKHNGMYVVESTEDKGKVAWKFEYLVEERRAPSTGKIMDGEKRFTPLRFVCNPDLLTSEHGKRVKLLQFVRKSVTPKLNSYMLGPSTFRPPMTVAGPGQGRAGKTEGSGVGLESRNASRSQGAEADATGTASGSSRDNEVTDIRPVIGQSMLAHPGDPVLLSSEGDQSDVSAPPDARTSENGHTAYIRPGQRIVSPSVLHAMFPVHDASPELRNEPGGLLPPPRRAKRSNARSCHTLTEGQCTRDG